MQIEPSGDSATVRFVSQDFVVEQKAEGLELHRATVVEQVTRTVTELRDDYRRVVGHVLAMTQDVPVASDIRLTEIEVGLAFNASGELGFIAKATAGIEATIKLKFEREPVSSPSNNPKPSPEL